MVGGICFRKTMSPIWAAPDLIIKREQDLFFTAVELSIATAFIEVSQA